jgi:hypothetical protein
MPRKDNPMNEKPEPIAQGAPNHDGLAAIAIGVVAAALIAMMIIFLV